MTRLVVLVARTLGGTPVEQTLEMLRRHKIVKAVASGPLDYVDRIIETREPMRRCVEAVRVYPSVSPSPRLGFEQIAPWR